MTPRKDDRPDADPEWAWALRLFFSADLVGSTSLKSVPGNVWVPHFRSFYADFNERVHERIRATDATGKARAGERLLHLWKTNGDELLYAAEVFHSSDVVDHFTTFMEAVRAHNESISTSGDRNARHVRGTAWLAGFPLRNRRIALDGSSNVRDFIGPDVDLGFRLTKIREHRHDLLVLSPHFAHLLRQCLRLSDAPRPSWPWTYVTASSFHGIHDGRPIPVTAIRLAPMTARDRLEGKVDGSPHDIDQVVEEFLDQDDVLGPGGMRPFCVHDPNLRDDRQMKRLEEMRLKQFRQARADRDRGKDFGNREAQRSAHRAGIDLAELEAWVRSNLFPVRNADVRDGGAPTPQSRPARGKRRRKR